ncbi:MAG: preprotein translocase subunit SecG [bacterium]|nr:preprotein translocase subunit SecG [bacterium]
MLKTIITILFVLICIALIVIVLLQESKQRGLSGAVGGGADTYWGKHKGRSMEGALETFTKVAAVAFLVLALILNII